MLKKGIITTIFLLYSSITFAVGLNTQSIPQDSNIRPYAAIIGKDPDGKWQLLTLKEISPGKYSFDLGTLTAQVMGSINAVLNIDNPVWEAQPHTLVIQTVENITLAPYGTYTWSWGYSEGLYTPMDYFSYLTVMSSNNRIIDYCTISLWSGKTSPTYLLLASEITPANPQNIFMTPHPIDMRSVGDGKYQLRVQNKSASSQNLTISLIFPQFKR